MEAAHGQTPWLLDAGEGTLGQLYRARGAAGATAIVARMPAVFVSHMHADHHLGVFGVLRARQALPTPPAEPLVIVGPAPLELVLTELQACLALPPYTFVDADRLRPGRADPEARYAARRILEGGGGAVPSPWAAVGMPGYATTGAVSWCSARSEASLPMPCPSCTARWPTATSLPAPRAAKRGSWCTRMERRAPRAAGASYPTQRALHLTRGCAWHPASFSGDTRPCTALISAGKKATWLIHEATFDDQLRDDAIAKRHSTLTDALSVAVQYAPATRGG